MRTAFHLIEGDEDQQRTVLTIAENLKNDETADVEDIVIVAQAGGIAPVTGDGTHRDVVESLMDEGISFRACANTLDTKGLDESDLVEGVETVSSGATELTRLQDDGYAYIRP